MTQSQEHRLELQTTDVELGSVQDQVLMKTKLRYFWLSGWIGT